MTQTNSIVAKLAVAFVAVAMAFSLVAPAAKAQDVSSMSLEELVKLVNQLQGQLAGSGSSMSGSCSYTFTRSLTQGSSGADVMNLQKFLNMSADTQVSASGAGAPGMETSFFGPATAGAVSKFQTKYSADILVPAGLTSPTGYFGPATMAKANALCKGGTTGGGTTGGGTTGSDLEGGAGSVDNYDLVSSLSNEEVGEGEDDSEVAGLEVEVDDGSDIEITAIKLDFDQGTATSDFDEFAGEVSIWVDGEEFARVDGSDFQDDDDFDKTITLDEGAIIKAGDKGEIVVAVSGASSIDSDDEGDTWTVDFTSVRFRDAQGSVISENPDTDARTFTFESFASASDLEFKVSAGDDEINDARSIQVSSTTDTDAVEIMSFEIELEGNSDVNIDTLPVTFTSVGAQVDDLANTAELVVDGEVIGSESLGSAASSTSYEVAFDDLDWDVEAGDTVEVIVRVDMNEMNGATAHTFSAGDTLSASVDADDTTWDIEDEEGDNVEVEDRSGASNGDAHAFYGDGIQVAQNSVTDSDSSVDGNDNDYVTLTIKFDVTAFGEDAYVQNAIDVTVGTAASTGTAPTNAVGVHVQSADTGLASGAVSATLTSTADEETNSFLVEEGETETFTLKVVVTNSSSSVLDNADVRAILNGVGFSDTESATSDFMFTSNITDIKTDYGHIAD